MKKIKNYINQFSLGVAIILTYFLLPNIKYVVVYLANGYPISTTMNIILSVLIEVLTMAIIILLFHKKIEKDFKDLKKNHKEYFSKYFKYYLIGLGVMYISNAILIFEFQNGISGNEETIRAMLDVHPIYVYISAVLIAPSMEELVFRGGIRNIITNDKLFIIASGLIFGGLHLLGNINSFIDVLYIIPYSSLGIAFAYIYSKTDNIFVTMLLHTMHNGILICLQLAVMLFG